MPTVNAIARQVELTADVSSKIFRTDFDRSADSVLIKGSIDTAADMVNSGFGLRSNISEMLGNYEEDRDNFNSEFDETMSSLRQSADRLKAQDNAQVEDTDGALSTLGDFATFKIPPEAMARIRERERLQRENAQEVADMQRQQVQGEREVLTRQTSTVENFADEYLVAETQDEDDTPTIADTIQNLNSTRDENTAAALSNVRNFVNTFNSAVNYLNENRGMSSRMNALASNFGDNENLTQSLDSVGISVNEDGRLRVNEDRLADALTEDSSNVNAVLGQNGLAGRLDRNVNLANSQRENLFPTIADYAGDRREEPTESLYAAQNKRTAAHNRLNAGRFLNMFT